ncbi:bifunctional oligoribonuclease and PAP phosphatase NrnA [Spirochaetia bacterium]|nr:bifunctional oligoribonuclease and PAP phosphatase NrnA [Spirochaetia bacterium]
MQNDRQKILNFIANNTCFALTTHDGADADGIGAEIAMVYILKHLGKTVRVLNASPVPERFRFMDGGRLVEIWDPKTHGGIPGKSALIILDTSDEFNTGAMKDIIPQFQAVMVIDHHDLNPHSTLEGYIDPSAAATCEMMVDIAGALGIAVDRETAVALYAGLIYDSGSFAYSKTTIRTFNAASVLVLAGASPYEIYGKLNESISTASLLLQRQVLSTLILHCGNRVAALTLRKEDLAATGAHFEDAEPLVNIPLKSKEILVSIMVKENSEGKIRCSLRSKGMGGVNVSKIAQQFSGGGHALAAGFCSEFTFEETLTRVLETVQDALEKL